MSERLRAILASGHYSDVLLWNDIASVLAELDSLRNPWRPIDDEAKTGDDVMLIDNRMFHDCRPDVGSWRRQRGLVNAEPRWISKDGNYLDPTHYMPIPSVPKGEPRGGSR